jgi:hypothetical protein
MIPLALAIALAWPVPGPAAVEGRDERRSLAGLEKAYWACDRASATHGVLDMDVAAACGAVIGELQRRKFGGDFNAMLAWWQRNKAREHRRLDLRAGAGR